MPAPKTKSVAGAPELGNVIDNWKFFLVGAGGTLPFHSYVSSIDPTTAAPGVLIGGAQNVYKNLRGNIAIRPGLKVRGNLDTTLAGTVSSTEWETSNGVTRVLRVNNGSFQVEYDSGDGNGKVWRDLITGLSLTRFTFDPWWDNSLKKDRLLIAIGDGNLRSWSGGIGTVASATANSITLSGTAAAKSQGFDGGQNTVVIGGVTYTYTDAGYSASTNFNQTPTVAQVTLSSGARYSQLITTTASSTQVLTVSTTVNCTTAGSGADVFVCALYTDNAGVPGTLVTSAQAVIGSPSGTNNTGTSPLTFTLNKNITAGTNYHLVLYKQSGNAVWKAYTGAAPAVGTNVSSDGGVTWSATNGYLNLVEVENVASPNTLVGVTPDPSAIVAGTVVVQPPMVRNNVPDATFIVDFVKVVGNQAHCGSYSSSLVYVSAKNDYSNYTVPAVRAPGDPDLLTLDSLCRGITAQRDSKGTASIAVLSGTLGDWYTVARAPLTVGNSTGATLTEQVTVQKSQSADLATALGHEFITNVGDNILFLDQSNQLREFGTARNITNPVYPILSLDVFTEFKNLDFTGGHLRAVADEAGETIYLTCPLSGIHYFYQIRHKIDAVGNVTGERLWQPPQICGLSRIAVIQGVTYGHSVANPMMYQLWDTGQWHDDGPTGDALAYEFHMLFSYLNQGRTELCTFDKIFTEGYMTKGSVVGCNVLQEYQASKNLVSVVINNPDKNAKHARFYNSQQENALGDGSLGDNPLGDGIIFTSDPNSSQPKFRCVRQVTVVRMFEYALDVFGNTADTQCELVSIGTNQVPVAELPVVLTKSD